MGGSSGGGLLSGDLRRLEARAKGKIAEASGDPHSRHFFISFDHDDLNEVNLFRGQAKNDNTDLNFDDHSVKEPYNSSNSDYIKQKINEKIERCSATVVYLTDKSASSPWVNWEISQSVKMGKAVVGVYKGDSAPNSLPKEFAANNCTAVKWGGDLNGAVETAISKLGK